MIWTMMIMCDGGSMKSINKIKHARKGIHPFIIMDYDNKVILWHERQRQDLEYRWCLNLTMLK